LLLIIFLFLKQQSFKKYATSPQVCGHHLMCPPSAIQRRISWGYTLGSLPAWLYPTPIALGPQTLAKNGFFIPSVVSSPLLFCQQNLHRTPRKGRRCLCGGVHREVEVVRAGAAPPNLQHPEAHWHGHHWVDCRRPDGEHRFSLTPSQANCYSHPIAPRKFFPADSGNFSAEVMQFLYLWYSIPPSSSHHLACSAGWRVVFSKVRRKCAFVVLLGLEIHLVPYFTLVVDPVAGCC
jgi:hypothetical protein